MELDYVISGLALWTLLGFFSSFFMRPVRSAAVSIVQIVACGPCAWLVILAIVLHDLYLVRRLRK